MAEPWRSLILCVLASLIDACWSKVFDRGCGKDHQSISIPFQTTSTLPESNIATIDFQVLTVSFRELRGVFAAFCSNSWT